MQDKDAIPKHVAIIMDGNGRWARERGLHRTAGHREGIKRVKEIVKAARELGIEVVTLFAFSTENWLRSKTEVAMLMRSLDRFLEREVDELHRSNIKFIVIGRADPLPQYLQNKIKEAQVKTKDNTAMTVCLALNYGARQEIADAAKRFGRALLKREVTIEDLDADTFGNYLYTRGLPDPDLLIRTSGEMRISNFLLWQLSYTELYFPQKYWPDFKKEDLQEAVKEYQRRERRFGKVYADKKDR